MTPNPDRGIGRAHTWPVLLGEPRYPGSARGLIGVQSRGPDRSAAWSAALDYCASTWPDGQTVPVRLGLVPMTVGELERVRALLGNYGASHIKHAAAGVDVVDPRPRGHGLYVRPVHVPRDLFDIGPDLAAQAGTALDKYRAHHRTPERPSPTGYVTPAAEREADAIRCAASVVPDAFQLIGWRAWLGPWSTSPTFDTREQAEACMRVHGHHVRALKVDGVTVASFHSGARHGDGPGCRDYGTYAGPPLLRVLGEQVDTMPERVAWMQARDRGEHAGKFRDMPASETDYVRAAERPRLARLRAAVLDIAAMIRPHAEVCHVGPETLAEIERDPGSAQLAELAGMAT